MGKHFITDIKERRPIEFGESPESKREPKTIMQVWNEGIKKNGDQDAYQWKQDGKWHSTTWKQYNEQVQETAKSYMHVGIKPNDVVSIIGFNSPEWITSFMAGQAAGCIPAGIYASNGPDACQYQVSHSESTIVLAQGAEHMKKFVQVLDKLPLVKAFVQWGPEELPEGTTDIFYKWEDFVKLGKDISDSDLENCTADVSPEQTACLIYTSGTTAMPKGTMISHDNCTWTTSVVADLYDLTPKERIVSYLPLSHIAALLLDILAPNQIGLCIYFAQPDALRGSLGETLKEVKPTIFLGVPRVWEKIEEKMKSVGAANSPTKQMIAGWAKGVGLAGAYAEQTGNTTPWGWWAANKIVLSKVREALGLQFCKMQGTAAAPISKETLDYFMSLNIPISEIYGMSECTGPQTMNLPVAGKQRTGTVGTPIPGVEMKLDSPDADGNGEICYRGRHIFLGYLNNPEATEETFDDEGYLHSGDVGKLDGDGFLSITGRLKELIITAGGENIAPVLIEQEIIKHCGRLVSNVMVIGDKRKFLTCVITLRAAPNPVQEEGVYPFSDKIDGGALKVCEEIGSSATTVSEGINDEAIKKYIESAIKTANENAISNAQRVQKFEILASDFSVEGTELTPTLKLKRRIVAQKYEEIIDKMYDV